MGHQRKAVRDQRKVLKSDTVDPALLEAITGLCYQNQKSRRGYKPDRPKKCLHCGKHILAMVALLRTQNTIDVAR